MPSPSSPFDWDCCFRSQNACKILFESEDTSLVCVPNFFHQELAGKIANGLENMMKDEEKLSWRYNTCTFVRRPCSCKYKYPGFDEERHKTVYFDDACDATTAAVVEICRHLSDIAKVPSGKLPDVVVVNRYAEAASCIAWHADDQPDL